MLVNYVVEGSSDTGFAQRIIIDSGNELGREIVKRGCTKQDAKISGYKKAARIGPTVAWLVLRDSDGKCPVELRAEKDDPAQPVPNFVYRVVHTMTESWLLADPHNASEYFHIPESKIGHDPEHLDHPKRHLLRLCREHSPRDIREDMVADTEPLAMGPLFTERLKEFALRHWDIDVARKNSPSLDSAIRRLQVMPR